MITIKLNEREKLEYKALNDAIIAAAACANTFLDSKMLASSKLQVGDEIYDLKEGKCLGRVTELYRIGLSIFYRFEIEPNVIDNTSAYGNNKLFGTKAEAEAYKLKNL